MVCMDRITSPEGLRSALKKPFDLEKAWISLFLRLHARAVRKAVLMVNALRQICSSLP